MNLASTSGFKDLTSQQVAAQNDQFSMPNNYNASAPQAASA